MDDSHVERWRNGDAHAATAVRNMIRSTAERVLSHPALPGVVGPNAAAELADEDRRRELTARLAAEVMRRPASTVAQVKALALMAASRHAVEAMQAAWPKTDEAHLPPQVAVTMALSGGAASARVQEAAARHLSECKRCSEASRVIERVVRSHDVAIDPSQRVDVGDEVAAGADATLPNPVGQSAPPVARVVGEARRKRPSKAAPPSRKGPPVTSSEARQGAPAWVYGLFALAVSALGVWMWWDREAEDGPAPDQTVPGLAELADLSPPEVGRVSDLPPDVQFAVGDLASGACRTAAGRFRASRKQVPHIARLYVLEAGAFVCARDGKKALRALDDMDDMIASKGGSVPRSASWYRAQALILTGRATDALIALSDARINDPRHREQAGTQAAAIEALLR